MNNNKKIEASNRPYVKGNTTITMSLNTASISETVLPTEGVLLGNYVLTPCPVPPSVNIAELENRITKYMEDGRAEYFKEECQNINIEPGMSESFVAKSSGGYTTGKGNGKVDVVTSNEEGIDVTCLIINSSETNEKSLMQNFAQEGSNLDLLFENNKHEEAVELYASGYENKIKKCKEEKKLSDIYIMTFLSNKTDIYVSCFRINIDNIKNISSGGFVTDKRVNIIVNNFIDKRYGNVKLYKAKKRLELRLSNNILKHENTIKIYSMA